VSEVRIRGNRYFLQSFTTLRTLKKGDKVQIFIRGGASLGGLVWPKRQEPTHFCFESYCAEGLIEFMEQEEASVSWSKIIMIEVVEFRYDTIPCEGSFKSWRLPTLDDPVGELRRLRVPKS
jgi:hypothetical protein